MKTKICIHKNTIFQFILIITTSVMALYSAPEESLHQNELKNLVENYASKENTVGISIAIYDSSSKQTITETAGISHGETSIDPSMRWGIGSNSKTFAAVLCLKLAEANKLNLDDPVTQYLPNIKNLPKKLTIRQCLQHHSGLSDVYDHPLFSIRSEANPNKIWRPVEVLQFLPSPRSLPGEKGHYSASNYIVIAAIVEIATKLQYHEALRKHVIEPLNLKDTFVDGYEAESNMAHPWVGGVDTSTPDRTALNTSCSAAACMASTPSDMVHWYHALFKTQFLSKESFKTFTEMLPWTFDRFYQEVGLGIFRVNHNNRYYYAHGGGIHGYYSFTLHDIETGDSIIAMTTGDFLAAESLSYEIAELISNTSKSQKDQRIQ